MFYINYYMLYIYFISYYGIYWTNLLTRCHSALLFFISEKLHRKYSRNWTERKPSLLFSDMYTESNGEKEGSHDPSTPCGGAAPPLVVRAHGLGPTGGSDHRTSAYLFLRRENPKTIDHLPQKVPPRRRHRNLVSGVIRSCSGTLPG